MYKIPRQETFSLTSFNLYLYPCHIFNVYQHDIGMFLALTVYFIPLRVIFACHRFKCILRWLVNIHWIIQIRYGWKDKCTSFSKKTSSCKIFSITKIHYINKCIRTKSPSSIFGNLNFFLTFNYYTGACTKFWCIICMT